MNSPLLPAELDAQIRDLLARGKEIEAIRTYREFHHVDLKTAKDVVDAINYSVASPRRAASVTVRRDRIGRAVVRAIGVAVLAAGAMALPAAHTFGRAASIIVTAISLCSWMFYKARTVPGPAQHESNNDAGAA